MIVRELTRALLADKSTEEVTTRGTGGVNERWTIGIEEHRTGPDRTGRGVRARCEDARKSRRMLTQGIDLKLSFRGGVERTRSTWAILAKEAKNRIE